MRFRLGYATESKSLEPDFPRFLRKDPLRIALDDQRKTLVIIRFPTDDEVTYKRYKPHNVLIICEQDHPISDEAENILSCLEKRVLPPGSIRVLETDRFLDENGTVRERHVVPLKAMPMFYQHIQHGIYDGLYRCLQRSFRLLRWRYNLQSPANPLQLRIDIEYTRDNETWIPAPFTLTARLDFSVSRRIKGDSFINDVANEMRVVMLAMNDEPIGHMLWREAWEERNNNLRTSIVMAVAAAEVAVKSCIANRCPDTRWLFENIQSPPLGRILRKYWPTISHMPLVNKDRLIIPTSMIKKIEEAVEYRNNIVHVGNVEVGYAKVLEILETIHDLLAICDCAQGHFWAFEHLRDDTQKMIASGNRTV